MAATKRIGNEWAVKTRSGDRKESGVLRSGGRTPRRARSFEGSRRSARLDWKRSSTREQ
jgi:hypothetical protein